MRLPTENQFHHLIPELEKNGQQTRVQFKILLVYHTSLNHKSELKVDQTQCGFIHFAIQQQSKLRAYNLPTA